jgi:hypothetical protein
MPVANTERVGCCNMPNSVLECIRPSNFAEGSRVAPALAAGMAWPKPGTLSAGARGGIAAGVIVGVLAAGGLVLYFWIAKRRKRAQAASEASKVGGAAQSDAKPSAELMRAWGFMSLVRRIASRSLMVLLFRSWVVMVGRLLSWLVLRHRLSCRLGMLRGSDERHQPEPGKRTDFFFYALRKTTRPACCPRS